MKNSLYIAATVVVVMVLAVMNLALSFVFIGIWAFYTLTFRNATDID